VLQSYASSGCCDDSLSQSCLTPFGPMRWTRLYTFIIVLLTPPTMRGPYMSSGMVVYLLFLIFAHGDAKHMYTYSAINAPSSILMLNVVSSSDILWIIQGRSSSIYRQPELSSLIVPFSWSPVFLAKFAIARSPEQSNSSQRTPVDPAE